MINNNKQNTDSFKAQKSTFFKTYCGESNADTPIVKTNLKGVNNNAWEIFLKKTFQKKKQKIKKSSRRRTKKKRTTQV